MDLQKARHCSEIVGSQEGWEQGLRKVSVALGKGRHTAEFGGGDSFRDELRANCSDA